MASKIFTLFPDLPIEIRLQVWRLIFPQPRTIYISRIRTQIKKQVSVNFIEYQYGQKPSPLLRTNWESRLCYLDTYCKLSLGTCAFVDPFVDTLHFDRLSFATLIKDILFSSDCPLASKDVLKKIRRIETDVDGVGELVHKHKQKVKDSIGLFLRTFMGLEEICWIVERMGNFFRRYQYEIGNLAFHQMKWDDVFVHVGNVALRDSRDAFGLYATLHPKVRIPTMKVKVKLRGILDEV